MREALDWLSAAALERPIHPEPIPIHANDSSGRAARRRRRRHTACPRPTSSARSASVWRRRRSTRQHPGSFSYFTPPPLPMSIVGETLAAVGRNQGVDVWHAGPVGAVRRGGGDALALRPGRLRRTGLGRPHLRRRDGEPHGADRGARRPPARGSSVSTEPPRGARPRGRARLRVAIRPTSRSRGRSTCWVPARTLRVVAVRRPVPAARPSPVAEAIAEDRAAGLHAVRDRRRRRLDEHRLGRPHRRARRRRRARGPVAPRGRRVRRRPRACRRATRVASRVWSGPTRSRSIRTSGSSRPTTSAALLVRQRDDLPSDVPPRAGVLRARIGPQDEPLTGTSTRSRAPGGSARLSSGCRGSTWDRRARPARRARTSTWPPTCAARLPRRADDFDARRPSRSCRSCASGTCPPAWRAWPGRCIDALPDGPAARAGGRRRRLGQRHDATRPTYLRAGIVNYLTQRRPTSTGCSRRFAACQKASSKTSTSR